MLMSGLKSIQDRKNFFYNVSACRNKNKAAELFGIKYIYLEILYFAGLFLLITALSSPFISADIPAENSITRSTSSSGFTRDSILLVDISRSMLADDGEGLSRLEKSRQAAAGLVSSGTGRFGIVVFKGDAYTILPLTGNKNAVIEFVANLRPDIYSAEGTDIGRGLLKAVDSFPDQEKTEKRIFLFTDGEEPEKGCFSECRGEIAEKLRGKRISLFIVPPDKRNASVIPDSEISTGVDMKMIKQLERLPGAELESLNSIRGVLISKVPGKLNSQEHDLSLFFSLSGFIILIAALLLRGIKWRGII